MELIAKIKQTEAEGHQIIEKAKADAVTGADKGRQDRRQRQEQADLNRRRAIDATVEKARAEAQSEVKTLKTQAEQQRKQLRDQVQRKVAAAVTKVVEYLKKG
jgi:vacuolar-type H+-ATPase subunit H